MEETADNDIYQLTNYIKYKLLNPIVAEKLPDKILNQINILKQFPYLGKIYNLSNPNIRFLIHNKYLIFYEIQEKEKLIIIKTILHSKQNRELF